MTAQQIGCTRHSLFLCGLRKLTVFSENWNSLTMKSVVWFFFHRTACNWLSSRRWEIQNWICSGWNRIEILLQRQKSLKGGFPAFFAWVSPGCTISGSAHPPALCRRAKRQTGDLCCLLLFLLPHFTLPARIFLSPSYYTPDCGPKLTPPPAAQTNSILLGGIPGAGLQWFPMCPF